MIRRPLLCGCLALIAVIVLYQCLADPPPWEPQLPRDLTGQQVIVTGQVYEKEVRTLYGKQILLLYLRSVTVSSDTGSGDGGSVPNFSEQQIKDKKIKDKLICQLNIDQMACESVSDREPVIEGTRKLSDQETAMESTRKLSDQEWQVCLGSRVAVQGELALYSHATNPGEWDSADYYLINGVSGSLKQAKLLGSDNGQWWLRERLKRCRNWLCQRLHQALPQQEAAILAKMLLGEKDGLDQELKELYQNNGIAHVLAISGLHITLLGMGLYRVLRRCGCPIIPAAIAGGCMILLYGGMIGWGISAVRAIGMYLIRMLGEIWGRHYDMLTAMGVLAAIMVCRNPRLVYHSGFLLSFGAVLGIGVVYPALAGLFQENRVMAAMRKQKLEENRRRWKEQGKQEQGKQVQGKQVQGKQVQGKQVQGKQVQGKQEQGKQVQGKQVQGKQVQGKQVQGKQEQGKQVQGKQIQEKHILRKTIQVIETELELLWLYRKQQLIHGFLASLSITLATLPVQLYFFYQIPVYGTLLNLVVLPLMSLLLTGGLVLLALPGVVPVQWLVRGILTLYEGLCRTAEQLPGHLWITGCPCWWQIMGYYLLLMLLVFLLRICGREKDGSGIKHSGDGLHGFLGKGISKCGLMHGFLGKGIGRFGLLYGFLGKGIGRFGLSHGFLGKGIGRFELLHFGGMKGKCCLLLVIAVALLVWRRDDGFSLTMLDVGQGDCICVHTAQGKNYLFDGGSSSRSYVGKNILIPYLKYQGITQLDGIFLSHGDEDHINAVRELLENSEGIRLKTLYLPKVTEQLQEDFDELVMLAREAGCEVVYLSQGMGWQQGDFRLTCLWPEADYTGDSNASSACYLLESGTYQILLTGDLEGEGEKELERYLQELSVFCVDVLKVAHHGSRYSTSDSFLQTVTPRLALISAGHENSYGHPHEETLERLEAAGTSIYRTDQCGAVIIEIKKDDVRIRGDVCP